MGQMADGPQLERAFAGGKNLAVAVRMTSLCSYYPLTNIQYFPSLSLHSNPKQLSMTASTCSLYLFYFPSK
jgi:hypothetical protein